MSPMMKKPNVKAVILVAILWSAICIVAIRAMVRPAVECYASGSPTQLPKLTLATLEILSVPFSEWVIVSLVAVFFLLRAYLQRSNGKPALGYPYMIVLGLVVAVIFGILYLPLIYSTAVPYQK